MQIQQALPIINTFIKSGDTLDYEDYDLFYMLDNNVLTDLALLARTSNENFQVFIKSLLIPDKRIAFILPEIILEESIGNNQMNPQVFSTLYNDFYQLLSAIFPIYLVTLQDNFDQFKLVEDSRAEYNKLAAFINTHPDIHIDEDGYLTIAEIEKLYRSHAKDAGERIAFLMCNAMIATRQKPVYFLSNEVKGVYNRYSGHYANNEQLHQLLDISDEALYQKLFKVQSYHKLLYNFVSTLNENERLTYLHNTRNINQLLSRHVSYSYHGILKYSPATNERFNEIVKNPNDQLFY